MIGKTSWLHPLCLMTITIKSLYCQSMTTTNPQTNHLKTVDHLGSNKNLVVPNFHQMPSTNRFKMTKKKFQTFKDLSR